MATFYCRSAHALQNGERTLFNNIATDFHKNVFFIRGQFSGSCNEYVDIKCPVCCTVNTVKQFLRHIHICIKKCAKGYSDIKSDNACGIFGFRKICKTFIQNLKKMPYKKLEFKNAEPG
jgi:hypothetical protein